MRRAFQFCLILALSVLSAQTAYSCLCARTTFERKIAATDFIFVGKVVEIKEDTARKRQPDESKRYIVKLQVVENFKGVKTNQINLVQYEITKITSCPDWNLEERETYLIYAGRNGKVIRHRTACSPTGKFDATSPIYKALLDYRAKKLQKKNNRRNYIKL